MKAGISELYKNSLIPVYICNTCAYSFPVPLLCFGNNRRLSDHCQFYFSSAQLHMPIEIQGCYFQSLAVLVLHNYSNCFLLRPKNSRAFPALSLSCKNKTHTYVCSQLKFNSNAFTCVLKGTAAKRLKGLFQSLQKSVYYTDFSVFYLMSQTET